jgi:hypothetical protein
LLGDSVRHVAFALFSSYEIRADAFYCSVALCDRLSVCWHSVDVNICIVSGIVILVAVDFAQNGVEQAPNAVFGDIFILIGATLYAVSNAWQEHMVRLSRCGRSVQKSSSFAGVVSSKERIYGIFGIVWFNFIVGASAAPRKNWFARNCLWQHRSSAHHRAFTRSVVSKRHFADDWRHCWASSAIFIGTNDDADCGQMLEMCKT